MGKRFVICSSQAEYCYYLSSYLAERQDLLLDISICTTYESLVEEQEKDEIDILLIDEEVSIEKRNKIIAKKTYVLTEGAAVLNEGESEVYQFQSAKTLVSEILQDCIERNENVIFRKGKKNNKRIIGIYSPIYDERRIDFAKKLCQELREAKQVLYITLEEYSALGEELFEEKRNLSDVLYYMKQEGPFLGAQIGIMVQQREWGDMIPPIPISQDLKEVPYEDWKMFFSRVLEESMYDVVLVEFGESVQGLLELLAMCEVVCMPTKADVVSQSKIRHLRMVLDQLQEEGLYKRMLEVSMEGNLERAVLEIVRKIGSGSIDND